MSSHASEQRHGALAHHFADIEQQKDAARLGMWIFLATEVMFFGGVIMSFAIYRSMFTPAFRAASDLQNVPLGAANTVILLCSSLTMVLAVHSAESRNRTGLVRFLVLTILLGTAFLGIKAIEYTHDYHEGLVPGAATFHPAEDLVAAWSAKGIEAKHVELYFVFYFVMTGLHALHMIIGIAVLGIQALMARRGRFTGDYPTPIELSGLYWHFVDVVWIFLFPLLYLLRH